MVTHEPSFAELLASLQDGDQDAAWQLIESFSDEILRVVRRRLPDDLRPKFDSEDFVQAAWASVFAHRSRLVQLNTPSEFIAYMAAVAGNKVKMEIRKRMVGQKFNVNRERTMSAFPDEVPGDERVRLDTPSEIAAARERWAMIMQRQPSRYRRMVQLRFQGISFQEIADRLHVDERTVRRVVKRIVGD